MDKQIPYEHKRGRCHRDENKQPSAWESDRIQVLAYACLLEFVLGIPISEGRIRYHADNVLVHVSLDDQGRVAVRDVIQQAREDEHVHALVEYHVSTFDAVRR